MGKFPSTQWLLVEIAGQSSEAVAREALDHLLRQYWQPLYVHLRVKGLSNEAAEDVLQDFIVEMLDKNLCAAADRERGRFRTLLLTALDRFLISKHRYQTAAKRAPDKLQSLQAGDGIDVPTADAAPVAAFEQAWALDVLAETLAAMQDECDASGDTARWAVFERRFLAPLLDGAEVTEYQQLADELGLANEKGAMNLLVTAKRQFSRVLRDQVRLYVEQSGPRSMKAQGAPLNPAASGARQLAEGAVVQAVEQEVLELRAILAQPRVDRDLPADEACRPEDSPRKRAFWLRLARPTAPPAARLAGIFQWGDQLAEGDLAVGFADLLEGDIQLLLGAGYVSRGPVIRFLTADVPMLMVLEHLKEWANVQRFARGATAHGRLADAMYFLTIAVAQARLGERIAGMNDAGLRDGLERLAASGLVDGPLLDDVRRALQAIPAGAPAPR